MTKPRLVVEAAVFWFFLFFCAASKFTRAVKFGLSWLILAKLTVIVLSKASIGLVGVLSWYPVVFWGFLGETLDFCGNFLVLFMA